MKLEFNNFMSIVKTKIEPSNTIEGLWIARSAVEIEINNIRKPIFGFGAAFDRTKCEKNSIYELLEHLIFIPDAHTKKSAGKPVTYWSNKLKLVKHAGNVKQFLIGSLGPKGIFYGNGCAISSKIQGAINHSRCELLERHLCCEIWYNRSRPLLLDINFQLNAFLPSVKLSFFTTNIIGDNSFAIASLECSETGFFGLGSAVRPNLEEAFKHAAGEIIMLFEDAKKERVGSCFKRSSQQKILSLRDAQISFERKKYFNSLVIRKAVYKKISPKFETITFEPLPKIYAARSFAYNALDPRAMELQCDLPTLPLF